MAEFERQRRETVAMHLEKPHGQMSESLLTAAFIILSGGLQDAYTYLCRGKVCVPFFFYCSFYHSLLYASSDTGSHHSFRQPSPGTSTAMWLNQLSFFAPCQCFTFAGIMTTLPSCRLTASLPSS